MVAPAKTSDHATVRAERPLGGGGGGGGERVPSPEELAAHFPQLEILDLLGYGGMGVVYKARQKSLDRIVALKVLLPRPDREECFTERFNRESRALARLQHPNIVTIHDSGAAGPYCYFIMEYVDGSNLRRMLATGSIQPGEAVAIIPPLCDALEYAHQEGVAHRDIKPENILIDRKGRVKIADFGIAKLLQRDPSGTGGGGRHALDHTLTGTSSTLGTLHYMAPEQIERPTTVDHRADIYSVGVVFYEMLTGELPIGRFDLPSQVCRAGGRPGGLDQRLDAVVLRSLEKEPAKRYQRISEVKNDLEVISHSRFIAGSAREGRSIGIAYLWWALACVGLCGVHRFYAGKWVSGLIWFFTLGLLFVGQLIDLFLIPDMIRLGNMKEQLAQLQRRAAAGAAPSSFH